MSRLLAEKERSKEEQKDSPFLSFSLSFSPLFSPTSFSSRRTQSLAIYEWVAPNITAEWGPRARRVHSLILLFFFTAIATSNVEDIRSVLDFYRQEDDIIEAFKRNQARLREAEEARSPQQTARSSWTGMFGRSFSFGRSSNNSVSRNNFVWFVVKMAELVNLFVILFC